jgi:A/G-specific adenine glycosylase
MACWAALSRSDTSGGMRWVPIATLADGALPNVMKAIAYGLGE